MKKLVFALCAFILVPLLEAQDQPVTRAAFEASTPEGYTAVTLTTNGSVWGVPERYTSDSAIGGVAYMLLGELKGCGFADAELNRDSRVYITVQRLGFGSGYESKTVCEKTSRVYRSQWVGHRITHLLFFDEGEADNTGEAVYNETAEEYQLVTATGVIQTHFGEGSSTERFITENAFGGVNVGDPVRATGSGALTYEMTGTDADSFAIVEDTGQIRTKDGVTYDYETKNRYSVDLLAKDDGGTEDTISVTIHVRNQLSPCVDSHDFRAIPGDKNVFVRWVELEDAEDYAYIQGYQVEMRQEPNGVWGNTRTLLGREIPGTLFTELVNDQQYKFRIRALNVEGDCEWHESSPVTPVALQRAPMNELEHFLRVGRRSIGTSERNYRFLSLDRCRHTANGSTLDATCAYENTGLTSGKITLEFDDPTKPGCSVSLAYSSLTAGSFHDQCFGAGVNVNFDASFHLPALPDDEEQTTSKLPRSEAEFNVLAWGRSDLIPGLGFGCLPGIPDCEFTPGKAYRIERDTTARTITYTNGSYTYEMSESGQGILKFEGADDKTFVFTLEPGPSSGLQVSVTEPDGGLPGWPGMPETLIQGGSQPVLLPIPPSWSAAIEIETDVAPEDIDGLAERIPLPDGTESRIGLVQGLLLGEVWEEAFKDSDGNTSLAIAHNMTYSKVGRNRAMVTITWERDGTNEALTDLQQKLLDSTFVFDLRFHTEDSASMTSTITLPGQPAIRDDAFIDLKFGTDTTESFPEELSLPDLPPQDSGEDVSGVQIAPVTSIASIGQDDRQTFLVHNSGVQPISYSPGDWLEPKDGGNQRMMVVSSSQAAGTGSAAQSRPIKTTDPAIAAAFETFRRFEQPNAHQSPEVLLPRMQSHNPALTQISVVCMQLGRDLPTRGARYFSKPKEAEGAVQQCQKDCATAGAANIQVCVWQCELDPNHATPALDTGDDPYEPFQGFRISNGRVQLSFFSAGGCINLTNATVNGITYTFHTSHWQRRANEDAPWTDISGTEHEGGVCSYSPTEQGQYRAVGEVSIDGVRGKYSSENILTVP